MTADWILVVGTLIFAVTTWATLNFGYAQFRELGRRDDAASDAATSADVASTGTSAVEDAPGAPLPDAAASGSSHHV
jgi:hypothetical protein